MVLKQKFNQPLQAWRLLEANTYKVMISVKEATDIILQHTRKTSEELVALSEALGRICVEDWCSDTSLPPFDRVMMDGIAVSHSDLLGGIRSYSITGIQQAGKPAMQLDGEGTCLEVMTGAVCPIGADVIIPYEDIEIVDGNAIVGKKEYKAQQNIHLRGSDRKKGDALVRANSIIGPAEIGVAASIGMSQVKVYAKLNCMIFSTGDELVEVDALPLPYQIRRSNVYALQALMLTTGVNPVIGHLHDNPEELESALKTALNNFDFILLSGGVSKGKFDFLPEILEGLGVKKGFHRIAQKPGKPMWFGSTETCAVFALPGNPVSTFMCACRYVLPWVSQSMHQAVLGHYARLESTMVVKPGLTHFLQVKLSRNEKGETLATAVPGNGSGDFSNLILADAFMQIDASVYQGSEERIFPIYPFTFSQF
jgi:molybdopterin molybdotransferase